MVKKDVKQAGAELCQAQPRLSLELAWAAHTKLSETRIGS